jgi:DNA polymerase-3 subunit gamma/tau
LSRQDGAAVLREVDQIDERAPDYSAVLDELLEALQHIAVLQLVSGRLSDDELAELAPLSEQLAPDDVQLYYQIALHGRRDLPVCRDPRVGFEMTLLRMLAFRPTSGAGTVDADAAPARAAPGGKPTAVGAQAGSTRSAQRATAVTAAPARATPATLPTTDEPRVQLVASANGNASVGSAPAEWAVLLQSLDLRGPARQLADHCDLRSNADGAWHLVLPADKEHLNTQQLRARLESALKEQFGSHLRLTISAGKPARPTPAQIRKANEDERMREARETIESDPNVKALQSAFDATLEADSIRSTK